MHAYAAQSPGSNGLPLALACRHADHCLQCLSLLLPTAARLFFIACLHEQSLAGTCSCASAVQLCVVAWAPRRRPAAALSHSGARSKRAASPRRPARAGGRPAARARRRAELNACAAAHGHGAPGRAHRCSARAPARNSTLLYPIRLRRTHSPGGDRRPLFTLEATTPVSGRHGRAAWCWRAATGSMQLGGRHAAGGAACSHPTVSGAGERPGRRAALAPATPWRQPGARAARARPDAGGGRAGVLGALGLPVARGPQRQELPHAPDREVRGHLHVPRQQLPAVHVRPAGLARALAPLCAAPLQPRGYGEPFVCSAYAAHP